MLNPKFARDLQENDWIEVGGFPYQVEKPIERNPLGEIIVHLRPMPGMAADIAMLVRADLEFEIENTP